MNAGPTAAEIVVAVSAWLADGAAGAADFQGKVAANALGIVARELDLGPAAAARASARLSALTGGVGSVVELEEAVCAMIDTGVIALDDPRLVEHLRATARDRLAIDQPRYRSLLGQPPTAAS